MQEDVWNGGQQNKYMTASVEHEATSKYWQSYRQVLGPLCFIHTRSIDTYTDNQGYLT